MRHVSDNAEESVRRVLDRLEDGAFTCETDFGAKVSVRITVDRAGRSAVIDFAGTSPQVDTNYNAPQAVCMAAVLYVFRRSEEHTSELQSLMRISYAVFCLKKKNYTNIILQFDTNTTKLRPKHEN